jgi:uncharacterized protein
MNFEFDPQKSDYNKLKHRIDSHGAHALWNDPDLIEVPLKTSDEPRFLVVGKILDNFWSGIVTYRTDKTRIISVRRSRREVVDIYENHQS